MNKNLHFKNKQIIDLLFFFSIRVVKIRYRKTLVGIFWMFIKPALSLMIFTLLFKYIISIKIDSDSYAIFFLTGIIPWIFFSQILSDFSNAYIDNPKLVNRVYMPKFIIPMSYFFVNFIEFVLSMFLVIIIYYFLINDFNINLFLLFKSVFLLVIFSLSFGILVGSLHTRFRDIKHIIPLILQVGILISPVAYSTLMIPEMLLKIYYLNPLALIIDSFREAFGLGDYSNSETLFSLFTIMLSISFALAVYMYFKKRLSEFL